MTPELEQIRADATARLDAASARLREELLEPCPHTLVWEPYAFGMKAKVGKGWLKVSHQRVGSYPGVNYTSCMGANSDNSYGGFLPGVTFDEALLLVYRDYKRNTR